MIASAFVDRSRGPNQVAGSGSLAWTASRETAPRLALFVDAAVASRAQSLLAPAELSQPVATFVISGAVTWDDVEQFASEVGRAGAESVIAIGGGNVMDAAKLAAACAKEPGMGAYLRARSAVGGLVPLRAGKLSLPVVCAPTTIGTGAEASAVACCEWREEEAVYKCLVSFPRSPVVAAAYEPALLDAPRTLRLAGLAESWTRVLGAAVGAASSLKWAEAEACSLVERTSAIAEAALATPEPSDDHRIESALASAASHSGWSLRGRGIAPFPLWFVANELSMVLRTTKMQATALLMTGWLESVAEGRSEWGDARRLNRMLAISGTPSGADALRRINALIEPSTLAPGTDASALASTVATRVLRRFGGGRPLSHKVTHESVARLVERSFLAPSGGAG